MNSEDRAVISDFLMEQFQEMQILLDYTDVVSESVHYIMSLRAVMDVAWNGIHMLISPYPETVDLEPVPQADALLQVPEGTGVLAITPAFHIESCRARGRQPVPQAPKLVPVTEPVPSGIYEAEVLEMEHSCFPRERCLWAEECIMN